MMKQFLMTAAILVGTAGIANAQVTVAGSTSVDSSTDASGHHYSASENTIQKNEDGDTVTQHESVSHDQHTTQTDDNGDVVKEVIPTGAIKSENIHRTETGRVVLEKE